MSSRRKKKISIRMPEAARYVGFTVFIIGIAGFIPLFAPQGQLLGLFQVNASQNFFHLILGIAGLVASSTGLYTSRFFFQVCGVLFAALAALDCGNLVDDMFTVIAGNASSFYLHSLIGGLCLFIGFSRTWKKGLTIAWQVGRPPRPATRRVRLALPRNVNPEPAAPFESEDFADEDLTGVPPLQIARWDFAHRKMQHHPVHREHA